MMVNDPVLFEQTGLSKDEFVRCQQAIEESARAKILWHTYFSSLNGDIPNTAELKSLVTLICSIAGV